MNQSNIDVLNTFTLETLPDLDMAVLGALELYEHTTPPKISIKYKRPLVVGSGNGEVTGRIMFENFDAIFASESNYESKLAAIESIDGVVLISASGAKHAPIIVKRVKELGKHVTLMTTTENSEAHSLLDFASGDEEYVFPKNREPYTYNTSTYMGMILGLTGESAQEIGVFIKEHVAAIDFSKTAQYEKFFLIVPSKLSLIARMLQIKFIELFGRAIARDVETFDYVKRHAATIVTSKELFISFGEKNTMWGEEGARIHIPLPENANYATVMAIGYYVIGMIQKQHHPYFKESIEKYTQEVSRSFGHTITPIVE